ncbi:hypothetical protein Geu3261_0079_008 [Komagataeibacter europaeus NBRC 3261]|uniref:Uncharacterized protein n=1 Tax=Komagataeibacter europaeus NBRC 3261 TaxID=1234669 RepID=A0A0D6PZS4_KOMEU|nr:hypothetical protein Geu3261_0079_008 [Komagataeibacter europaeus NBRC 3261]
MNEDQKTAIIADATDDIASLTCLASHALSATWEGPDTMGAQCALRFALREIDARAGRIMEVMG